MPPESKTKEGFESQFGVNFLGPFLLPDLLYNKLKSIQNLRVLLISRISHKGGSFFLNEKSFKRF